uniref:Homeobox domain-containing protein n=1 Tax=Strongyloides venezuelensis TaxID=75913 RepID=A0A0K0G136_STRVS
MSSSNLNMTDEVALKVIIKPNISFTDVSDQYLSQLKIEKTLSLDGKTVVNDLCKEVVEKCCLEHLVDHLQVFIRHPNQEFYPLCSYFPNMNAKIGSFCHLLEGSMTIKILVPVESFDFIEMTKADRVYESFIKYLLSKMGDNKSQSTDPVIQFVTNVVKCCPIRQLPLETLIQVDEKLTHALQSNVRSMSGDVAPPPDKDNNLNLSSVARDTICSGGNSSLSSYKVHPKKVPPVTIVRKHKEMKFKEEEVAFLEDWYELVGGARPDDCVLKIIVDALNSISGRSEPNKIASKNVFNWWKRRRNNEIGGIIC